MSQTLHGRPARARALRWTGYVATPALAVAAAWFATRNRADANDASGHQHGAALASTTAQPLMLTANEAQRIGVTYAVASHVPLAREIRTVGQVTYDETRVTTVSLKIDGWVEALYVNFTGQALGARAPLLSVYSPMLVTAQEELLLARRLVTDVAGAAPDARDDAAALLASARRRLAYWDVPAADIDRVERSGEVQRALTLRAPVGGFVVEKNVQQGQRVMAGDPLYRIADLSTVWVEGEVFERDMAAVRLGQEVNAELDAMPGRPRAGRITYVYPTLDPETRTVRIRVELANASLQLKPGMYATLTWRGAAAAPLSVPRTAVVATGTRNLVFVKRADGMLEPRLVEIGAVTTDRVAILTGVAVGDTVVKSATFLLDAESNLGTLLGGMGNMPGMDMSAPTASARKPEEPRAHTNH